MQTGLRRLSSLLPSLSAKQAPYSLDDEIDWSSVRRVDSFEAPLAIFESVETGCNAIAALILHKELLIAGFLNARIQIYSMPTMRLIGSFDHHATEIRSICAFESFDSKSTGIIYTTIISASIDGTIALWSIPSSQQLRSSAPVRAVHLVSSVASPRPSQWAESLLAFDDVGGDGSGPSTSAPATVWAGGSSGHVRVWTVAAGAAAAAAAAFAAHSAAVTSLCLAPAVEVRPHRPRRRPAMHPRAAGCPRGVLIPGAGPGPPAADGGGRRW